MKKILLTIFLVAILIVGTTMIVLRAREAQ